MLKRVISFVSNKKQVCVKLAAWGRSLKGRSGCMLWQPKRGGKEGSTFFLLSFLLKKKKKKKRGKEG